MSVLNLDNQQNSEAFDNYDEAIELDPENEDIYISRAYVRQSLNFQNFDYHYLTLDLNIEIRFKTIEIQIN